MSLILVDFDWFVGLDTKPLWFPSYVIHTDRVVLIAPKESSAVVA